MFSEASVSHSVQGGLPPEGVCLQKGPASAGSASGGSASRGCLPPGVFIQEFCLQGVCPNPLTSSGGHCSSYYAFLVLNIKLLLSEMIIYHQIVCISNVFFMLSLWLCLPVQLGLR